MENRTIGSVIYSIYWMSSIIYAFVYWSFWYGILNIFIPYSLIYDLIIKLGKIK